MIEFEVLDLDDFMDRLEDDTQLDTMRHVNSLDESMNIEILYTDDDLIAVNKPPGLSVHEAPGPGSSVLRELSRQTGAADLAPIHRLDINSSGVLLFGRSKDAVKKMSGMWPSVHKTYFALCEGLPANQYGIIDAPILEHQTGKPERLRNALRYYTQQHGDSAIPAPPAPKTSAVHPAGRASTTEYCLIESFSLSPLSGGLGQAWCWLELHPKQGRMHQIRVHLAHIGHALAVDPIYGKRTVLTQSDFGMEGAEVILKRVPLHAARLEFPHPRDSSRKVIVEAPLPEDIQSALALLKRACTPPAPR